MGKSSSAKLGLTVSRRFGNALARNRFKRVTREAFRLLYPDFPSNLELNVRPQRKDFLMNSREVELEFKKFLSQQFTANHFTL